jgi:hypothetical protein
MRARLYRQTSTGWELLGECELQTANPPRSAEQIAVVLSVDHPEPSRPPLFAQAHLEPA